MVIIGLSGCSGGGSDDSEPAPTTTAASATPQDEAIAVVEAYWAERIRVENSADYASADFEGILDSDLIAERRDTYAMQADLGIQRIGAPVRRDHAAEVDGRRAVVTMCVNEGPWTAAETEGVITQQPEDEFYAVGYTLELVDDGWLMTSEGETPPEDITC